MLLKKARIAYQMLITRTRRSLLRLVLEQHDFTKSLAVLWTFCESGAKCQQSTLLARLGNHRRSAETARGLAYACKTYLDGIRLIRDRRKKPVLLQKPTPDSTALPQSCAAWWEQPQGITMQAFTIHFYC